MIKMFRDKYAFLSNFYQAPQWVNAIRFGIDLPIVFQTNEHYFQSLKTDDFDMFMAIAHAPTPAIAKKMASLEGYTMPNGEIFKINIVADWDSVKLKTMAGGLRLKFTCNPDLAQLLVNTFPEGIEEGNFWRDRFWGVDLTTGKGLNHLGKLLMTCRDELIFNGMKPQN